MPLLLQWFSYLIPLRYFLVIVRGIVLKGIGIESLVPEVVAITIFGIAILAISAQRFRKRLE